MNKTISASLMCADLLNLGSEINTLEKLGVDYLHLDFMDGDFVSNITFGTGFICACRDAAHSIGIDIHIMGTPPERFFDRLKITKGDIVSFHYEACENCNEIIDMLHQRGAKAFLAINPSTPPEVICDYLDTIDGVLAMTVEPGDSGRPLAEGSLKKLEAIRKLLDNCGREDLVLEVDGCVSWINAPKMHSAGADMFVVGTSSVFEKKSDYSEAVPRFRKIING